MGSSEEYDEAINQFAQMPQPLVQNPHESEGTPFICPIHTTPGLHTGMKCCQNTIPLQLGI
jgi:hypothetical protein